MEDIGFVMQDTEEELFLLDVWQEIELLNEAMQVSRREYNYSQESLSQNICEPETISRSGWVWTTTAPPSSTTRPT